MEFAQGLRIVGQINPDAWLREASAAGYATFILPADDVIDRPSFFAAVRTTMPLDPPVHSSRSWDALSDSLWQGLLELPNAHIAILWPRAHRMAAAEAQEFHIALDVLRDVTRSLGTTSSTAGHPKVISVTVEAAESVN